VRSRGAERARLLEEARRRLGPCVDPEIPRRYVAGFDHPQLLKAANHVRACHDKRQRTALGINEPAEWTKFFPVDGADEKNRVPSADLLEVSETFVKLQALRHKADYHAEWDVTFDEATTGVIAPR
jgi:hypothetical protein